MASEDTVKLLRECNAGIKMGVDSIDQVLDRISDDKLKEILIDNKEKHQALGSETHKLLNEVHDDGKEPNPMAKSMSWIKTNVMLAMEKTDQTVADLITDGCNMGVKSLNRYLNQYPAASEEAKKLTRKLISLEASLRDDIECYL